jgi:hypothetical protein
MMRRPLFGARNVCATRPFVGTLPSPPGGPAGHAASGSRVGGEVGGDAGVGTHVPPWHVPSAQETPSGKVPLHLPFLRFLHGGQPFFFLFFALVEKDVTGPKPPSRASRPRPRRRLRTRVRASKVDTSMRRLSGWDADDSNRAYTLSVRSLTARCSQRRSPRGVADSATRHTAGYREKYLSAGEMLTVWRRADTVS